MLSVDGRVLRVRSHLEDALHDPEVDRVINQLMSSNYASYEPGRVFVPLPEASAASVRSLVNLIDYAEFLLAHLANLCLVSPSRLEHAANVFERMAFLRKALVSSGQAGADDAILSSLDYTLGDSPPRSIVVARESQRLPVAVETEDRHPSLVEVEHALLRIAAQLVARELDDALHQSVMVERRKSELEARIHQAFVAGRIDRGDVLRFLAIFDLVLGIKKFCLYLLNIDVERGATGAREHVARALTILQAMEDSVHLRIALRLLLLFECMENNSIVKILSRDDLKALKKYTPVFLKHGIYELWTPERKALVGNEALTSISSPFHAVVSIPAGGGKTMVNEIAILHALSSNEEEENVCIYLVPSRALASQVTQDLSKRLEDVGFPVLSLVGATPLRFEETTELASFRVLVTTPEKLEGLLAQPPQEELPLVKRKLQATTLVIVDECHLLDESNEERGLSLEFMILRLRETFPQTRFVLSSAVLANPESICEWLNDDPRIRPVAESWKPTEVILAVVRSDGVLTFESGIEIPVMSRSDARRPEEATRRLTRYLIERADPGRMKSILIFVNSRQKTSRIAGKLLNEGIYYDLNQVDRNAELIQMVRAYFELAPQQETLLTRCLRKGIAFHHAGVPSPIRNGVEQAIRKGEINIIVSTSTLAEGMNFPTSHIIIPTVKSHWEREQGWQYLPAALLQNLVGRAGRPLQDTEGHAIFIQGTEDIERILKVWDSIQTPASLDSRSQRMSGVSVRSGINRVYERVLAGRATHEDSLLRAYERALLACLNEDIVEPTINSSTELLSKTLFWRESEASPSKRATVVRHSFQILQRLAAVESQKRYWVQSTSMSTRSCDMIVDELMTEETTVFSADRLGEASRSLLRYAFVPLETRPELPGDSDENLLLEWMKGVDRSDVFRGQKDLFMANHQSRDAGAALVSFHTYVEMVLRQKSPWALSAFLKMLRYLRQTAWASKNIAVSTFTALLPRLAYYGVDHPVAAFLCDLGVDDRKGCVRLAERATLLGLQAPGTDPVLDWRAVVEWFERIPREALVDSLADTLDEQRLNGFVTQAIRAKRLIQQFSREQVSIFERWLATSAI